LRRSIELLDVGDEARARVEVLAYLERVPRSKLAQSLLLQIDTAPSIYYPEAYRELTLEQGQSLSSVAKTYLGTPYEFFALARYNDIEQPRRVVPGQVIRIPLTPEAIAAFEMSATDDTSTADVMEGAAEAATSVVDALEDDDEVLEELKELDGADPAEKRDYTSEINATGETSIGSSLSTKDPVAGTMAEDDGATSAESGTPGATAAVSASAREPAAIDVNAMHRRAINAYRAQDLDTAISIWDEILTVNPNFDQARLYRSQAEALKARLQALQ
jgi:hypothetical protein